MPRELSTALITLADLDNPEVAMFAHEEVIRQLLKDGVEMSHAHTVLCTAEYRLLSRTDCCTRLGTMAPIGAYPFPCPNRTLFTLT